MNTIRIPKALWIWPNFILASIHITFITSCYCVFYIKLSFTVRYSSSESLFTMICSVLLIDLKMCTIITRLNYIPLRITLCTDACPLMQQDYRIHWLFWLALCQLLADKFPAISHSPSTHTHTHRPACALTRQTFHLFSSTF
jgi:hypothetical protein